jgi:HAMP domain-containing protein
MKLRSKFVLSILLVTAVMSGITIYMVKSHIEQSALTAVQQKTAAYIAVKAGERLTAQNFEDTEFPRQKETFSTFMKLIKTPEILKIKVFNARFDIVYSTNEQDIGKKTDSVNYRNSLSNKAVVALIKPPETEAANIDMLGYRQVMELYVPVELQGRQVGVIETYFRLDAVNREIASTSRFVIGLILGFSVAVIVAIYALLTSMVIRPLGKISSAVNAISTGRSGVEIPAPAVADEIGELAASLKKVLQKDIRVEKRF